MKQTFLLLGAIGLTLSGSMAALHAEADVPADVRMAMEGLYAQNPARQQEAAKALAAIGKPAVDALVSGSNHEDLYIRRRVVSVLASMGGPAVGPLVAALREGASAAASARAASALVKIGQPAVTPLIGALNDSGLDVRRRAAHALVEIGDSRSIESVIPVLKAGMQHSGWPIRVRAVSALAEIALADPGDQRAVGPLIAALGDRNSRASVLAARALGGIGDPRAAAPLTAALKHRRAYVRVAAADALRRVGGEGAAAEGAHVVPLARRKLAMPRVRARGGFALVVLPDSDNAPDHYLHDELQWIKRAKHDLNIVMVVHVGDISAGGPLWKSASKAFRNIHGTVPYVLCIGNHDLIGNGGYGRMPPGLKSLRDTRINAYFPPSRFTGNPLYSGQFGSDKSAHFMTAGRIDNYYLLFEAAGMKFIVIALEFKPRDEVLSWANRVVAGHQDRRCVVATHSYLDCGYRRIVPPHYLVKGNTGEAVWSKLVRRHKNIFMVLCGHTAGGGCLTSVGDSGNTVFQILSDYQDWHDGGEGYLRILAFFPEEDRIQVQTYSPTLDRHRHSRLAWKDDHFAIKYPMRNAR